MELIEGPTLAQRLGAGRLGLDEAERPLAALCAALGAAHEAGIIHRDFKASNVLLRVGGEGSRGIRAVVTDFGLALPEEAPATPITTSPSARPSTWRPSSCAVSVDAAPAISTRSAASSSRW